MNQKYSDYLFETSWEICNKVGGIYTVLSTKAATVVGNYHDHYICIGPDIPKEYNDDFVEDSTLFKNWRDIVARDGLKVRIGDFRTVGLYRARVVWLCCWSRDRKFLQLLLQLDGQDRGALP